MRSEKFLVTVLTLSAAALIFARCAAVEKKTAMPPPTVAPPAEDAREIWQLVNVTAVVEAVDRATREVTIREPRGNVVTFTADEQIERLNEFKTGDRVAVEYYISLATEIREPTPGEMHAPPTVLEGLHRTPPGATPVAAGLRQARAVVTIAAIDRLEERVTLRGPFGRKLTVQVIDPSRLDEVSIGDTVIVTFTEALAISLEKNE